MAFGYTQSGFVLKRLDDIKSSLETRFKAKFGQDIKTSPFSIFGQLIGVLSGSYATLWEQYQVAFWTMDPDKAYGEALTSLCALFGVYRLKATQSVGSVTFTGTSGTVIDAGTLLAHSGTGEQFETTGAVTILGGGTVTAAVKSVNYGAIEANAGTLTELVSNVSGVDAVTNSLDAVMGREREEDAALRIRFKQVRATGKSSLPAMYAKLFTVTDLLSVVIYENDEDVPDAAGRPKKSLEFVVLGGSDEDVAEAIFDTKAGGIKTVSTATGTRNISRNVTDVAGKEHTITFSRALEVNIWIKIEITSSQNITSGELEAVKAKALELGNSLQLADDVMVWRFKSSVSSETVDKIDDVSDVIVKVGTSASPTGTVNITVGDTEIPRFDSTRIEVVQL